MKGKALGWEGNSLRSYRWGVLLLALPPGLALAALLRIYRLTLKIEPVDLSPLPKNALIYGYHVDLIPTCVHVTYLRQYPGRAYLLGSHTFLSYLVNISTWLAVPGMQIHRYHPNERGGQARGWVRENLNDHPELRMGIFTDSGGPYEQVRESLVGLARATGRPCVALRIRADQAVRIFHHVIPLPGARIQVQFSPVVPAAEVTLEVLQVAIDALDRVQRAS